MTQRIYPRGRCRHCRRYGRLGGRGLHHSCYSRLWRQGGLDEWPPLRNRVPVDVVLDTWHRIASDPPEGTTVADIAGRLGMTRSALCKAVERARRSGDGRAVALPRWPVEVYRQYRR